MRILILHSRYLSADASGENRVVEDETRLLREAGHDVQVWSPSPTELQGFGLVRTGARAIWWREAAREVGERVRRWGFDVVHCHNLFPMFSPAVIGAARTEGAAVVVTLHNYRFVCLPATLRRNGRECQDCLGKVPWRGVVHGCYRSSAIGSGVLATALSFHRLAGTFDSVDMYLPVSDFVRDKYLQAGFSADRLWVKPNFTWPAERREGPGDYFLFLGRLSQEKGVDVLLRAWEGRPERLLVVGDGPEREALERSAPAGVEFTGAVSSAEVPSLLANARALLVPSRWPDAAPRVILEAYAAGVPVVASAVSGLVELVDDGGSGLLLHDGPADWSRAVDRLLDDGESMRMGEDAWTIWSTRFAPERALANLTAAYESALAGTSAARVTMEPVLQ